MSAIICRNCGHDRKAHEIGLPETQNPKLILPGYKMSLSSCIIELSFNPNPGEIRRVECRKLRHSY
jgi:hypothetical protein